MNTPQLVIEQRSSNSQGAVAVPSKNTAQPLVKANQARREVIIVNDSTAILYLLYGAGVPSSSNYTLQLPANTAGVATLIEDEFTGQISGIWASANGFAYVTEVVGA